MKNKLYVYLNIKKEDYYVGELIFYDNVNVEETYYTFEYSDEWLSCKYAYPLSYDMPLRKGLLKSKNLFVGISFGSYVTPQSFCFEYLLFYLAKHDLLDENEKFNSEQYHRWTYLSSNKSCKLSHFFEPEHKLSDIKALVYSNDIVRNGSFRFKLNKDGSFVDIPEQKIPSIDELQSVKDCIAKVKEEKETVQDLDFLYPCLSGLNGRKSKCSIYDRDGNLCIAKFPTNIEFEQEEFKIDVFGLELAREFGINVQKTSCEKTLDGEDVLVLSRFDRKGDERIPFLALGAFDPAIFATNDKLISDVITKICKHNPKKNLHEYFKRRLLRIAIRNTVSFYHNIAFLLDVDTNSWNFSPDYDITVNFDIAYSKENYQKTAKIRTQKIAKKISAFVQKSHYYRLSHKKAKKIVAELYNVLKNYRAKALKYGFSEEEIDSLGIYLDAFKHIKYSKKR